MSYTAWTIQGKQNKQGCRKRIILWHSNWKRNNWTTKEETEQQWVNLGTSHRKGILKTEKTIAQNKEISNQRIPWCHIWSMNQVLPCRSLAACSRDIAFCCLERFSTPMHNIPWKVVLLLGLIPQPPKALCIWLHPKLVYDGRLKHSSPNACTFYPKATFDINQEGIQIKLQYLTP